MPHTVLYLNVNNTSETRGITALRDSAPVVIESRIGPWGGICHTDHVGDAAIDAALAIIQ